MNYSALPGAGDYESFEPTSALDPRIYDDADGCDDGTLDTIAEARDWLDMAEVAHKNGDAEKALHCIQEMKALIDEVLE